MPNELLKETTAGDRPAVGDVIVATGGPKAFRGCLMYVQEAKAWGVQAGMILPGDVDHTYMRLQDGEYQVVGTLGDIDLEEGI